MTTWRARFDEALRENGESWADVEANTMTEEEMNKEVYTDTWNLPFTVWTKNTVYFPLCYDSVDWIGHVARHPNGRPTEHQGGR